MFPAAFLARFPIAPAALCYAACMAHQALAVESAGPSDPRGLLPPLMPEGRQDFEKMARDLAPAPKKPRIIIMDANVTVNGQPRSDLGAAFSDTMSAKVLAAEAFEVIDSSALGSSAPNALEVAHTALDPQGNPAVGLGMALDLGKANGADFVFVPTLIAASDELRLSIRKLRIPSGKVEGIFQDIAQGDLKQVFALAERAARKILPTVAEPPDSTPKFDYVKVWITPPPPYDPLKRAIQSAPKALKASPTCAAARAWSDNSHAHTEPDRIGQISEVDDRWSFCEISVAPGKVKLGDRVFAWSGNSQDNLFSLNVSRIDGTRAIVEFDSLNPQSKSLQRGLPVYTWKTPAK